MPWVFLILFGLVGLVLLAAAGYIGKENLEFRAQRVQVAGVITGQMGTTCSSTENGGTRSYDCDQPVARFEYQGGSWEEPIPGERGVPYASGTPVMLVVDFNQKPPEVMLDVPGLWIPPVVLLLAGLIFAGAGFLGFKIWGSIP